VTISLVAIMLELTGGMTYIVPFMIAAPWENDGFSHAEIDL